MKNKRTLTIAAVIVALAAIAAFVVFRNTQPVHAQDQLPLSVNDRISFGMVGITAGQTMRISVTNVIPPPVGDLPPGPYRVVLRFLDGSGHVIRNRSGEVIRRVATLENGQSTFLDLDFGELPPGPIRAQFRAVVNAVPPPTGDLPPPVGDRIVSTVEVINNANDRTQFVLTNPGVIRGFNPQPDPPLGE